jgi:hypothetical protein
LFVFNSFKETKGAKMLQTTVEELSEWMGLKKSLVLKIVKLGIELGEIKEVGTSEVVGKSKEVAVYEVPDELKFVFLPAKQSVVEEVSENLNDEKLVAQSEELPVEETSNLLPRKFILRCMKCRWGRTSTGLSSDLSDLKETTSCTNCGKTRQFRCPRCGQTAKLTRIRNVS